MTSHSDSLTELSHAYASSRTLGSYVAKSVIQGSFQVPGKSGISAPIRVTVGQRVPGPDSLLHFVSVYSSDIFQSGEEVHVSLWVGEFDERFTLVVEAALLADLNVKLQFVGSLVQHFALPPSTILRKQWQLVDANK